MSGRTANVPIMPPDAGESTEMRNRVSIVQSSKRPGSQGDETMLGLMQDRPLLISSLVEHAATFHPETEIVSRRPEGGTRRTTWRGIRDQARQVAGLLRDLGVRQGDRVATLAWNSDRHLALYYGVSGSGAVLHTVNPRLFPDQIDYIVNHAEDEVLFFDACFAPLVEKLAPRFKTVKHFIALCGREHLPAT